MIIPTAPRDRNAFRVAIFCALPLEAENVQSVFDICWEDQDVQYGKAVGDQNSYTTGVIAKRNVVLVHMPGMGGNSAALAAAGLRSSYPRIRLALVVGICGVVPVHPSTKQEIVLGDVIISTSVIQYDLGKQYPNGFQRKEEIRDSLDHADPEIRSFLSKLTTLPARKRFIDKLEQLTCSTKFRDTTPASTYPGVDRDRLYAASYVHRHRSSETCDRCLPEHRTCSRNCDELGCEDEQLVLRKRHTMNTESTREGASHAPYVHLGRFGSANAVMKSGLDRDRISMADKVIAFEMEGAGVWEQYPTIVIKAACDYADSHKNKDWQDFAAAMAAGCSKVFLTEWVIPEQSSDTGASSGPLWHIPFDPMPGFIGRINEMEDLEQKLFGAHGHHVVSLLGLGGVGKSRLALEFSHRIKLKHPHYSVLWLQASNQSTLENDMLEVGRRLGITGIEDEKADVKVLFRQRLNLSLTDKWLLILDNADDEALWGKRSQPDQQELSLVEYLPKTTNGSILVTTRTRRVASFLAQRNVISVSHMSQQEAAELFSSKLEDTSLATDYNSLSTVVKKLACLPLAIVQAASYVNMTEITIRSYIDLLDQPQAEVVKLLSKDFGDASRYLDAINPIATTWLISFEHIRNRHTLAASFLSIMACLHEKGIPTSLLPRVESRVDNIDALAILTGYSFVMKQNKVHGPTDAEELYDIHSLVQLAAGGWLKQKGTFVEWTKACIVQLAKVFPTDKHEQKSLYYMYLPHAQRVCKEYDGHDFVEQYDLFQKMGYTYISDGKYDQAVKLLTAVVEWREHALSKLDKTTFDAYGALGQALIFQNDLVQADIYLQKAVRGQTSVLGESDLSTLCSKSDLARLFVSQGKYSKAETTYKEVLYDMYKVPGKCDLSTRIVMSSLASVLITLGKDDEAERIQREALQPSMMFGSKSEAKMLAGRGNLVHVLRRQGKYMEAENEIWKTLQLAETELGKDHPQTLILMAHLALVLGEQDKHSEAEGLCRKILQLQDDLRGRSHPETIACMINLANMLREQDKLVEAERYGREALYLSQTVLGEVHSLTWNCMNTLARILNDQKSHVEAEKLYCEVLRSQETVLCKSHPFRLNHMNDLALALDDQGEHKRAEKLYREVSELQKTVRGESHPDTLAVMNNLAFNLKRQNRTAEAVKLMRSCAELRAASLGLEHPRTQRSFQRLAEWLDVEGSMGQQEDEIKIQMPGSWVD